MLRLAIVKHKRKKIVQVFPLQGWLLYSKHRLEQIPCFFGGKAMKIIRIEM
jgi:hypothetical protein